MRQSPLPLTPLPGSDSFPVSQEVIVLPEHRDEELLISRVLHVSPDSLVLRWEPLPQVAYYQISVNGVLDEKRITSVVFTLSDLFADRIAKIQVIGFDKKGLQIASSHVMEVKTPAMPIGGRGGGASNFVQPIPSPTGNPVPVVERIEVEQAFRYQGFNYSDQGFVLEPTRRLLIFALAPGILRAIDQSLELEWEIDLGSYVSGAPVSSSWGDTFAGTLDGRVVAVSSFGTLIWETELDEGDVFIRGIALNENNGLLYVTTHTGSLYAIDMYGGEVRWQRVLSTGFLNPPVINASGDVLVGDVEGNWFFLDAETELQTWTYRSTINEKTSLGIALDGLFYLSFQETGLRCVDQKGHLIWSFDEAGVLGSPVIDEKGQIYFVTNQKELIVIDTWGKIIQRISLPSQASGHLLLDKEHNLYVATPEEILVFNQNGYQIGRADLEETAPGSLIAVDDSLWLMGALGNIMQYPMFHALSPYALWPRSYGQTTNQNIFKREEL